MRTFEHFPKDKECLLCGKNTDGPCILAGIDGTERDGNEQATPIHVDCIDLRYNPNVGVFYQREAGL